MPQLGPIGWIVVGFLAGALSGMVVGGRTARGCLPNILIGILGAIVGGYIATRVLNLDPTSEWISALVVAFAGALIIRWLLALASPRR
jgi:uncharacterized membrane protein YeaQ/YmgE (transglycosylase-associated protein family)